MPRISGWIMAALPPAMFVLTLSLTHLPAAAGADREEGQQSSPAGRQLRIDLNAPDLLPQAVQYAVFDRDPLVAFAARLKQRGRSSRPGLDNEARMKIAWNLGFREVTGDKVYLLSKGPGAQTADAEMMSHVPAGKKWIATKAVEFQGKAACWCIPVEVKSGEAIDVVLDQANLLSLASIFEKGGQAGAVAGLERRAAPNKSHAEEAARLSTEGWKAWQQGRMDEALPKFEEAVKLDPQNGATWNGLAWASFNSGKLPEAEKAFRRVLELNSSAPAALNGLGQLYFRQRKYDEAETWLLKAAPNSDAAWWALAKLYLLQGKFAQAEPWAEKIVQSGQGQAADRDLARQLLQAAKEKQLSGELRAMIEPPAAGS